MDAVTFEVSPLLPTGIPRRLEMGLVVSFDSGHFRAAAGCSRLDGIVVH